MADTDNTQQFQPLQDPLVVQARFLNEASALDSRLAARKALRPARSNAARKGWETRRV